jgi:hypothetical protein
MSIPFEFIIRDFLLENTTAFLGYWYEKINIFDSTIKRKKLAPIYPILGVCTKV